MHAHTRQIKQLTAIAFDKIIVIVLHTKEVTASRNAIGGNYSL